MEAWQLNHIKNNLPQLLANTDCNVSLISILESKDVLSKQESELIQSKQTKYEKAKCLFKIIETRNNSYKILLSALDETKQSGAHLILNANFIKFNQFGNLEYQKEKRLGRISGCGEFVYYKGKFSNRKTAIRKECYTGDTEYATSRIKREIDLLTKLDCQENILRYFTCKFDDDLRHLLIVFERCSTTLEIYVRQRKDELDKAKKTSILQQLTSALCFLQFKNIIYLNLRPSSILISEDLPNNPRPKFSNFSSAFRSADGKGNVLANTLEKNKDWLPGNIQSSIPKRLKEVNVVSFVYKIH